MDSPHGNKRGHARGRLGDAFSIALIGFVLLGLGGALYKALKPDGWLGLAMDHVWSRSPTLVWLIGFGFTGALLLIKWSLDRIPAAERSSEAVIYAFMALGLFFLFQLIVTGSL